MDQHIILDGLNALLRTTRSYADALPQKIEAMQMAYLRSSAIQYDESELELLKYYLRSFTFKYYLAALHLEQLWALVHGAGVKYQIRKVLENSFDRNDFSTDPLLLSSWTFESFAIQTTATFDFIGLYLACFFRIGPIPHLSEFKLIEALEAINIPEFQSSAQVVRQYYLKPPERARRELLRGVRHSLVHRDIRIPAPDQGKTLLDQVIESAPEWLIDSKISDFSQQMQNDLFFLATDLLPNLYGLNWIPGPYRPGLWE